MSADTHPANLDDNELLRQCEARQQRRSGPGGQHRNKVETAVILRHRPTGVSAEANERRSAADNRRVALRRLRIRLALAVRRDRDPEAFRPGALWTARCRGGRVSINAGHADFPALLAEALDALACCDDDVKAAAGLLTITPSQFVGFLKKEPQAFAALNDRRRQAGLRALR